MLHCFNITTLFNNLFAESLTGRFNTAVQLMIMLTDWSNTNIIFYNIKCFWNYLLKSGDRYNNKPGSVNVVINLLYILLYSSSETIAM